MVKLLTVHIIEGFNYNMNITLNVCKIYYLAANQSSKDITCAPWYITNSSLLNDLKLQAVMLFMSTVLSKSMLLNILI